MNLATAVIKLNHLRHNIKYLQSLSKDSLLYPVIKANAYGHGFEEISKFLQEIDISGVCIATINELKDLVNLNYKYSILHLGKISFSDFYIYKNKNVIATINSIEDINSINKLNACNSPIRVHIKIDTGMSRMGCDVSDFKSIFNQCLESEYIKLEGVYSHLANSDSPEVEYNNKQISIFTDIINNIDKETLKSLKIHLLNSGGLFNYKDYKYNIIRCGLAVYGISPLGYLNNLLKPVMEFKAPIILNKNINKGVMVGYGCSFTAKKNIKISIIQCGYGDGLPFCYSNKGFVYYENHILPVIGRISMDLICVDSTNIDCKINDSVTIWGGSVQESRLENLAVSFNVIPYSFITGLTNRVIREYVDE